jgi:hypothetical protein
MKMKKILILFLFIYNYTQSQIKEELNFDSYARFIVWHSFYPDEKTEYFRLFNSKDNNFKISVTTLNSISKLYFENKSTLKYKNCFLDFVFTRFSEFEKLKIDQCSINNLPKFPSINKKRKIDFKDEIKFDSITNKVNIKRTFFKIRNHKELTLSYIFIYSNKNVSLNLSAFYYDASHTNLYIPEPIGFKDYKIEKIILINNDEISSIVDFIETKKIDIKLSL